jgi:hypothetical protein
MSAACCASTACTRLEKQLDRQLVRADFTRTPFEIMDAMTAHYIDGVRVSRERFQQWLDEQEAERLAGKRRKGVVRSRPAG